ncbi:Formimidoylglutamase [Raoultella planticola]|uniref:Formimidoylglutamase n=1 Tax=Raoultella planticola TaxID=575 RepID=A0A485AUQ1_RAOPL|nr:Formimidoylglutamase [Raoultella planticola]
MRRHSVMARGVLDAFPGEKVGIINLDAHLDLRIADQASSGTPFRQLALECDAQQRGFHYTCIGASRAANTLALWDEAARRQVRVIEDLEVLDAFELRVAPEIARHIALYDRLYLTIDLDVLPAREMPAVSAPAALGITLATLLRIVEPLCRSGKLQAVDLVEFNPRFDIGQSRGPCGGPTGMANRPLVALTIQYILTVRRPLRIRKDRLCFHSNLDRACPVL